MLASISLKFTEFSEPLGIPAQGVTIFVGPNNSGKSLVLRELEQLLTRRVRLSDSGVETASDSEINKLLVDDFEIAWMSESELEQDILDFRKRSLLLGDPQVDVHILIGRFFDRWPVHLGDLRSSVKGHQNKRWVASQFLRHFLIRLDGRTRFDLTNDRERGDLLGPDRNILMHLFKDTDARKRIRHIVFDAFGVYFTIDQLSDNNLRIRLSQTEPDENEQNWNAAARSFHGQATHIKQAGDGIQAFVGLVCAVLSGDYRVILIDEPEAFLHPPLARKLGRQLTTNLRPGHTLMASTHSPDFLMGCLQASPQVRVVRLEYSNGKSKGKIVDSTTLTKLFKAPLLRSANVISGLFHDGVVVTESDNDRAFYSEIYNRLVEHEKGYPSVLFVNAQNKPTIKDIIGPLREFGVPAAAVVDIDIVKEGLVPLLKAAHVPSALHVGLGHQSASINKAFTDQGLNMKTGGITQLRKNDQDAANDLFDQLRQYGIFVVRDGELESWLPELRITSKKTAWTVEMLERMGSDPSDPTYVRPGTDGVWKFVPNIIEWIRNPQRKGTD